MTASSQPNIEIIQHQQTSEVLPDLIALLQDTVDSGASVGFLPPLSAAEAEEYWSGVLESLKSNSRVLLAVRLDGRIVGSVQLELIGKPNGRHRAEVQKLFVLQSYRQRGLARQLMQAVEQIAREQKRTLLVLDTRQGDTAEQLYRKIGYSEAGVIPAYAINETGGLDATVFFYKLLGTGEA